MKTFTALLLVLTVSTVSTYNIPQPQHDLQGWSEFIAKVKEIYLKFKSEGKEFVCSAKLQELLDVLGMPDDLDGAVGMAQSWICGSDDGELLMAKREEMELAAMADFLDKVKEIWAKMKNYSVDLVCSSKLQDLLDVLGVPDELDGAVKMAQNLICRDSALVKRSADMQVQGWNEFVERVKAIYSKLKSEGKGFICSAKLQELLDVLGMPDDLDGAVSMAQKWICGTSALLKRDALMEVQGWSDFVEKVKGFYLKLKTWGAEFACSSKLQDLLDVLGVPDDLDGAVKMAQDWICDDDEVLLKREEMELAAMSDFLEKVKEIWAKMKNYSVDLVCSSKLQDLLDVLGVPDELDGAVKMAQNLICDN